MSDFDLRLEANTFDFGLVPINVDAKDTKDVQDVSDKDVKDVKDVKDGNEAKDIYKTPPYAANFAVRPKSEPQYGKKRTLTNQQQQEISGVSPGFSKSYTQKRPKTKAQSGLQSGLQTIAQTVLQTIAQSGLQSGSNAQNKSQNGSQSSQTTQRYSPEIIPTPKRTPPPFPNVLSPNVLPLATTNKLPNVLSPNTQPTMLSNLLLSIATPKMSPLASPPRAPLRTPFQAVFRTPLKTTIQTLPDQKQQSIQQSTQQQQMQQIQQTQQTPEQKQEYEEIIRILASQTEGQSLFTDDHLGFKILFDEFCKDKSIMHGATGSTIKLSNGSYGTVYRYIDENKIAHAVKVSTFSIPRAGDDMKNNTVRFETGYAYQNAIREFKFLYLLKTTNAFITPDIEQISIYKPDPTKPNQRAMEIQMELYDADLSAYIKFERIFPLVVVQEMFILAIALGMRRILHGDLKLNQYLYKSNRNGVITDLRLADFGFSGVSGTDEPMYGSWATSCPVKVLEPMRCTVGDACLNTLQGQIDFAIHMNVLQLEASIFEYVEATDYPILDPNTGWQVWVGLSHFDREKYGNICDPKRFVRKRKIESDEVPCQIDFLYLVKEASRRYQQIDFR